jgi:hypothetical protein
MGRIISQKWSDEMKWKRENFGENLRLISENENWFKGWELMLRKCFVQQYLKFYTNDELIIEKLGSNPMKYRLK